MPRWLVLVGLLALLAGAQSGLEEAVFKAANRARLDHGVRALAWDDRLYRAARAHGEDMLRRGYFGHQGPGGPSPTERLWRAGVYALKVAENLYELDGPYLPGDFASRAVDGWLRSPGHRRNLLDPGFDRTAVAVLAQGTRYLAVQEFAYDPYRLRVRLGPAEDGPARAVELRGVAARPLALFFQGYPLARFGPGPVRGSWVLPAEGALALAYRQGSSYLEARCPTDCRRLGVELRVAPRRLPGRRVALMLRPGRYRLAFGEDPVPFSELAGPAAVFAPLAWRNLWLGRGATLYYRIPLRP